MTPALAALQHEPPPQNIVINLRGVNLKFDRPKKGETNIGPTLKPPASDSLAILNQAVDTLNRYPQVKVEINRYTDSVGAPQYNLGLSDRRAHIVADYLTSHGIDPSRITSIQGFGEADPINTNKTAAGRQRNRRVEFRVEQPVAACYGTPPSKTECFGDRLYTQVLGDPRSGSGGMGHRQSRRLRALQAVGGVTGPFRQCTLQPFSLPLAQYRCSCSPRIILPAPRK